MDVAIHDFLHGCCWPPWWSGCPLGGKNGLPWHWEAWVSTPFAVCFGWLFAFWELAHREEGSPRWTKPIALDCLLPGQIRTGTLVAHNLGCPLAQAPGLHLSGLLNFPHTPLKPIPTGLCGSFIFPCNTVSGCCAAAGFMIGAVVCFFSPSLAVGRETLKLQSPWTTYPETRVFSRLVLKYYNFFIRQFYHCYK